MLVPPNMMNSNIKPGIPLVDPPRTYENIQGYILRLTELNLYESPKWVYDLLDSENAELSYAAFRKFAETLPRLTGLSPAAIHKIIYLSQEGGNHNKIIVGGRGHVSAGLLDIVHPRICPGCINEFGAACALWDFKYYQVCTRHKCHLVDRCSNSECGRKLTWSRPFLARCRQCEQPYKIPPRAGVPKEDLLRFSALLEKQWGSPFEVCVPKSMGAFADLEFSEFYSLLHLLKNRLSGNIEIRSKTPRRNLKTTARLIGGCYTNWPDGYHAFLEALIRSDMKEGRGFTITNTSLFGSFFHRIMAGGRQSYFEPLKHEMLEYVHRSKFSAKITGKGGNRLDDVPVDQKQYMTRTEVMGLLLISAATFRKLFAQGILAGECLQMGKQHVYRVEARSIAEYRQKLKSE